MCRPRVLNKRNLGRSLPPDSVYVGRPSAFGNPFVVDRDGTREECVALFAEWIMLPEQAPLRERVRSELAGKHLVCWCAPQACHADVLVQIANFPVRAHA